MFPLEKLPPGDPTGGVIYLWTVLSPEEVSRIYMVYLFLERDYPGKEGTMETNIKVDIKLFGNEAK